MVTPGERSQFSFISSLVQGGGARKAHLLCRHLEMPSLRATLPSPRGTAPRRSAWGWAVLTQPACRRGGHLSPSWGGAGCTLGDWICLPPVQPRAGTQPVVPGQNLPWVRTPARTALAPGAAELSRTGRRSQLRVQHPVPWCLPFEYCFGHLLSFLPVEKLFPQSRVPEGPGTAWPQLLVVSL